MLNVKLKIRAGALETLRKQIEAKLTIKVAKVATEIYNSILHQEFPYYSGSYISSWNISLGSPDTSYNDPTWQRGTYLAPRESHGVVLSSPYQKVYISNYAPHAMKVEVEGTPTHPNDGWYVAAHARNNIVGAYKYF